MPAKGQIISEIIFIEEVKQKKSFQRRKLSLISICVCKKKGIIMVLSLVPLRWFIPIPVDSRLMHLDKSQPEVWVTPQHTRLCLCLDPSGPALTGCSTRLERFFSTLSWAEVRAGHPQEPWPLLGERLTIQMFCKVLLKSTKNPSTHLSPWGNTLIRSLIHWLRGLWCFRRLWPPPVLLWPGGSGW